MKFMYSLFVVFVLTGVLMTACGGNDNEPVTPPQDVSARLTEPLNNHQASGGRQLIKGGLTGVATNYAFDVWMNAVIAYYTSTTNGYAVVKEIMNAMTKTGEGSWEASYDTDWGRGAISINYDASREYPYQGNSWFSIGNNNEGIAKYIFNYTGVGKGNYILYLNLINVVVASNYTQWDMTSNPITFYMEYSHNWRQQYYKADLSHDTSTGDGQMTIYATNTFIWAAKGTLTYDYTNYAQKGSVDVDGVYVEWNINNPTVVQEKHYWDYSQ